MHAKPQLARSRRLLLASFAAALALLAGLAAQPAGAAPTSYGLRLIGTTTLSPRLLEITLHTAALTKDTHVRVLLPAGYASTKARYPVLYLLNGGAGSYVDWTEQGNAEKATAGLPLIVVMPDGGTGGNYTDWVGQDGSGRKPLWESYHITQLLPWIDQHFRTEGTRAGRAVAGISMGGNGAMHYAARHPDLFVAASAWSGAVDTFNDIIYPITETTGVADGALPGAVFGPRATEEVRWRGSNPPQLVGNLRSTWISLAMGTGEAGGPDGNGADPTEIAVHQSNVLLHDALLAQHTPVLWNDYGPGAHTWFYWKRDLVQTLPSIMRALGEHRPPPSTFSFSSIDPSYLVYGWSVHLTRPQLELSTLASASSHGFVLEGSGRGFVTTGPVFPLGKRVKVIVKDVSGTHSYTVRMGRGLRLKVAVDLGAPNLFQAYTVAAKAAGTTVRRAQITFS